MVLNKRAPAAWPRRGGVHERSIREGSAMGRKFACWVLSAALLAPVAVTPVLADGHGHGGHGGHGGGGLHGVHVGRGFHEHGGSFFRGGHRVGNFFRGGHGNGFRAVGVPGWGHGWGHGWGGWGGHWGDWDDHDGGGFPWWTLLLGAAAGYGAYRLYEDHHHDN